MVLALFRKADDFASVLSVWIALLDFGWPSTTPKGMAYGETSVAEQILWAVEWRRRCLNDCLLKCGTK